MHHNFDVEIATEYGVNAAIILANIHFWCEHNRANGTNYHDGLYWTYNSNKAFAELFPYMSGHQISTALNRLIEAGLIVKGNYNENRHDRTLWYAVTEKGMQILNKTETEPTESENANLENGKCITQKAQMETSKNANGNCENGKCNINNNINYLSITDKNPDINADSKPDEGTEKRKRFIPPTVDEVSAYAKEKGYTGFSATRFCDYYASNGWKVGKNTMRDWQAAVRSWQARDEQNRPRNHIPEYKDFDLSEGL